MNTTNNEIKEKEERLLSFKQYVEGLRNISDAEEYAKQLAHLFLSNGLSLQTILLMAIDFGQQHPNWISVEDELPEHNEEDNGLISYPTVLVCLYDGFRTEDYYDDISGEWRDYDGDVEYWMPMPQPPMKGGVRYD